jgi:hypothetical protein
MMRLPVAGPAHVNELLSAYRSGVAFVLGRCRET